MIFKIVTLVRRDCVTVFPACHAHQTAGSRISFLFRSIDGTRTRFSFRTSANEPESNRHSSDPIAGEFCGRGQGSHLKGISRKSLLPPLNGPARGGRLSGLSRPCPAALTLVPFPWASEFLAKSTSPGPNTHRGAVDRSELFRASGAIIPTLTHPLTFALGMPGLSPRFRGIGARLSGPSPPARAIPCGSGGAVSLYTPDPVSGE